MDLNLKDKVAIVTGGSRGLGKAICQTLAAEGVHVVINCATTIENAQRLSETIQKDHHVKALAVSADVSCYRQVNRLFDTTLSEFRKIDILINNAAIWPQTYVKDMTIEQWNHILAVNLTGPFLTCQKAVNYWLENKLTGTIVNISSQAAFHGATTGHSHYAASKAGVIAFTKSLAREVAANGIRVNTVAPGFMETDMIDKAMQKNRDRYLQRIPLQRIADPREVAEVVVFLASEKAGYVTGATFDVNGGMMMR